MPKVKRKSLAVFKREVEYTLTAEQDDTPVKGNVSAWDDDTDRKAEEEVNRRLDNGDVWAWAVVTVTATHPSFPGIVGRDTLGGCNYRNETEFTQEGGYYADMKAEALTDLVRQLESVAAAVGGFTFLETFSK
jgi:hypothetical protein